MNKAEMRCMEDNMARKLGIVERSLCWVLETFGELFAPLIAIAAGAVIVGYLVQSMRALLHW